MNAPATQRMRLPEFVAFIAACMALNALAIDVMLPALPMLRADFALADANVAQAVIAVYLIGMGASQIVYGPLSDRFGRRPVLVGGLLLFAAAGLWSAMTRDFDALLVARFVQGLGAGAPRVVAVSLARDTYSGAQMGRVMSLAMMVFMAVPILAPTLGQLIMWVAPWRWVFGALVAGGSAVLLWTLLRLQESLPAERRRPLVARAVLAGYRETLATRRSAGYMLALGVVLGGHFAFITSAQQIFVEVFGAQRSFTLLFAFVAVCMSVAAFINSRLVERFGMRRLAMRAMGLVIGLNAVHLALAFTAAETLPAYLLLQAASMFLFGFIVANLNTLAMEPVGHIAGTASAMVGFFTTCTGAALGFVVGQLFDGTVRPLLASYILLTAAALAVTWLTEREPAARPCPGCA